jgi:hypothetical protein
MMDLLHGVAHLDGNALFVLLLAAALAGVLGGVVPAWRRVWSDRDLPVRSFARRRGVALERTDRLGAELRCGMCQSKALCGRLLAMGAKSPPAGCPNARLFG